MSATGDAADAPAEVVVGVVGKPFGVRGDVHVHPDVDLDVDFAPGLRLHASRPAGTRDDDDPGPDRRPGTLVVADSAVHGGRQLVRFEGVEDRDAAEALRGTVVSLPRDEVPLDDDAWWSDELVGREVVDDSGAVVGVVEGTLDGTAHDYLVLARPDGGEVLVPAVAELVDVGTDPIVVHTIPGLVDDESDEA